MLIDLTVEIIKEDIRAYELRIQKAQAALRIIPTGYLPYPEFKKREHLKHDLTEEIKHVEYLISLAKGALENATD